jgi:hypothetical protein
MFIHDSLHQKRDTARIEDQRLESWSESCVEEALERAQCLGAHSSSAYVDTLE